VCFGVRSTMVPTPNVPRMALRGSARSAPSQSAAATTGVSNKTYLLVACCPFSCRLYLCAPDTKKASLRFTCNSSLLDVPILQYLQLLVMAFTLFSGFSALYSNISVANLQCNATHDHWTPTDLIFKLFIQHVAGTVKQRCTVAAWHIFFFFEILFPFF